MPFSFISPFYKLKNSMFYFPFHLSVAEKMYDILLEPTEPIVEPIVVEVLFWRLPSEGNINPSPYIPLTNIYRLNFNLHVVQHNLQLIKL